MKQHYVTFYSPGSFVAEADRREIDRWDPEMAANMAEEIKQRHGAVPYGFRFTTRARTPLDLDSREVAHSGMYFLEGVVETLEQVEQRADPKEATLLANMRCNGWDRIVTSTRGYRWTQPLTDEDVVLNEVGKKEKRL